MSDQSWKRFKEIICSGVFISGESPSCRTSIGNVKLTGKDANRQGPQIERQRTLRGPAPPGTCCRAPSNFFRYTVGRGQRATRSLPRRHLHRNGKTGTASGHQGACHERIFREMVERRVTIGVGSPSPRAGRIGSLYYHFNFPAFLTMHLFTS